MSNNPSTLCINVIAYPQQIFPWKRHADGNPPCKLTTTLIIANEIKEFYSED